MPDSVTSDGAMSDGATPPVFTLSYVPTVEDVAELVSIGVRKSRRAALTRIVLALVFVGIALIALMARTARPGGSGPAPVDDLIGFWLIGWSCALLWANARWLRVSSPLRMASRRRAADSALRTSYEVRLAEDGLTSRTDELAMRVRWSYFGAVQETRRQFVLMRPGGEVGFTLPKHALPDVAQVDALRAFLHTHIARPR